MSNCKTEQTTPPRIAFTIPGAPRSWKRANVVNGRLLEPGRQRVLKQIIVARFRTACVEQGMRWPKNAERYALRVQAFQHRKVSAVPDVDNLAKLVADALNGTAYEDDARIVRLVAEKHDVREVGGLPRTEVVLEVVG